MAGGNLYPRLRLVRQYEVEGVGIQRRPTAKEDAVLEHGLRSFPLGPALLVQQQGARDDGALGVADDAVKGPALLHDAVEELDGLAGALDGRGHALLHQLAHRLLGRLALGEVADLGQHVVVGRLLVVRLDEPVVRRLPEELLEPLGREGLARAVDEVERRRAVGAELFDDRGWWL